MDDLYYGENADDRGPLSGWSTSRLGPVRSVCALGVPITIHLAQGQAEVATVGEPYAGRSPTDYLDWLGLLAQDPLAAHCVASSDRDLKLMAARGATVLNCPRTFARAGVAAAFTAPDLIESVTATAAALIKRPDLGVIAPGAIADLTVVDLSHPHLQPLFDPRRGLVALEAQAAFNG